MIVQCDELSSVTLGDCEGSFKYSVLTHCSFSSRQPCFEVLSVMGLLLGTGLTGTLLECPVMASE
jgi:hypothetical protein